ncbi:Nudix family hydrolase [Ketobacter sp.]
MKRVHVVAAVIEGDVDRRHHQILLARRPSHLHQGGKWEFPGGKVEPSESVLPALQRELKEELNIEVTRAEPLIKISHDYPDKKVLLDVWKVTQFNGSPEGLEGQEIRWVRKSQLGDYEFPAANVPIVTAAQLPRRYVISPEIGASLDTYLDQLKTTVESGAELIQLRAKSASQPQWEAIRRCVRELKNRYGVQVLVNSDIAGVDASEFDGIHLTSRDLQAMRRRPEGIRWLSTSCHSSEQIAIAERLGVDFVTLSPVFATSSHPDAECLGKVDFTKLVEDAKVPVYALGGLHAGHLDWCLQSGAQGVAAITGLWGKSMQ